MEATSARVLIVDDHAVLAEVLATSLRDAGFVVETALGGSPDAVIETCQAAHPDVTLLDLGLWAETGDGLDLIAPLLGLGTRVIVLTGASDRLLHAQSIENGAQGVLEKRRPFEEIVEALHAAIAELPVNPQWETDMLRSELRAAEQDERDRLAPFEQLSKREQQTLAELMTGLNASDIADQQCVSLATVRSHIRAILTKLNVNSQLAAVAKAREHDWSLPD